MTNLEIIRHSIANYPHDELTLAGRELARLNKARFKGFNNVICSTLKRSQETALELGYDQPIIDDRLHEFEADIKAESSEAYIQEVHIRFAKDLYEQGDRLLEAIRDYGTEDCLMVAHNAVMSAAFYILTGDKLHFSNLDGFKLQINSCVVGKPERIKLKK